MLFHLLIVISIKERIKNLTNVKKDWLTVKNNPYAYQKFMYYAYRAVIILVAVIITFQIVRMVLSVSSGNNPMALLTRAFMVLVGVLIIMKIFGLLKDLKTTLLHYESNPVTIDNYINENKIDPVAEIDDILKKYDKKDTKLKGDK